MIHANQELEKGSEAVQLYVTAGERSEPAVIPLFLPRPRRGRIIQRMQLDFFEAPDWKGLTYRRFTSFTSGYVSLDGFTVLNTFQLLIHMIHSICVS